jgi:hypothetical protein
MPGVARGALGLLIVAGLVASGAPGCFIMPCADTFHGLSGGEHFTSTILGPYTEGTSSNSCGEVGDLLPGTTLFWIAHPDGPGDGCDDHVQMEVTAIEPGSVSGEELTLPNGCTAGIWRLTAEPLRDDTDFLANDLESPRWYIRRYMSGLSSACSPDGNPPGSCSDDFIATSKR